MPNETPEKNMTFLVIMDLIEIQKYNYLLIVHNEVCDCFTFLKRYFTLRKEEYFLENM